MTDKTINLALTPEEAATLYILTRFVGGEPVNSLRGHVEAIEAKLVEKGLSDIRVWSREVLAWPAAIYFRPNSADNVPFQRFVAEVAASE